MLRMVTLRRQTMNPNRDSAMTLASKHPSQTTADCTMVDCDHLTTTHML